MTHAERFTKLRAGWYRLLTRSEVLHVARVAEWMCEQEGETDYESVQARAYDLLRGEKEQDFNHRTAASLDAWLDGNGHRSRREERHLQPIAIHESGTTTEENHERLEDALSLMTERQRQVYVLYSDLRDWGQVAEAMGINKGSVHVHAAMARRRLREHGYEAEFRTGNHIQYQGSA